MKLAEKRADNKIKGNTEGGKEEKRLEDDGERERSLIWHGKKEFETRARGERRCVIELSERIYNPVNHHGSSASRRRAAQWELHISPAFTLCQMLGHHTLSISPSSQRAVAVMWQ